MALGSGKWSHEALASCQYWQHSTSIGKWALWPSPGLQMQKQPRTKQLSWLIWVPEEEGSLRPAASDLHCGQFCHLQWQSMWLVWGATRSPQSIRCLMQWLHRLSAAGDLPLWWYILIWPSLFLGLTCHSTDSVFPSVCFRPRFTCFHLPLHHYIWACLLFLVH